MKVDIYSRTLHIGTAELGDTLGGMGELYGKFFPNENYKFVRKEILDWFDSSGDDFHQKWRDLRFNAQLESGFFLFAIGHFSVDDVEDCPEDELFVSLAGVLRCVFEDLSDVSDDFSVKEKVFLLEPWQKITIEEKISFEDELEKELGLPRTYNKEIWNKPHNHLLAQTEFSALAKNSVTNEVIFLIHGEPTVMSENGKVFAFVAVVELTWSGKKEENEILPHTKLYQNLDEL